MGRILVRQKQARSFDLLIVLIVGVVLTGWSIALAHQAYVSTPNIEDFRHFAEPGSTKYEAKSVYLFAPILFEVAGLLGLVASLAPSIPFLPQHVREWLDPGFLWRRIEAYLFTLFFVACLLGTANNSSHALRATHKLIRPASLSDVRRLEGTATSSWVSYLGRWYNTNGPLQ